MKNDYIVSIWMNGIPNVGTYKGCGVCISNTHILTAKHVIENLEKSQIRVGAIPGYEKGMTLKNSFKHSEKDIAVLELNHPHRKNIISCLTEELSVENKIFQLLTYNQGEGSSKSRPNVSITNLVNESGWEITHEPNEGESGGALLLEDKLVAIVRAAYPDEKTGLVIPIFEVMEFLEDFISKKASNKKQQDTISDQELINIQIKAITKELDNNDAFVVKKAVTSHFFGQKSEDKGSEILAKKIVDYYKKEGRKALLNKLIVLTAELVKNDCTEKIAQHLDQLFSHIVLLTTPIKELQQCNLQKDEVIQLSVITPAAVEVYLSRLFKIAPKFRRIEDSSGKMIGVIGKCGFNFDSDDLKDQQSKEVQESIAFPEPGWLPELTANNIESTIKTAIDGRNKTTELNDFEREDLRESLATEKLIGNIYRIEVNITENNKHPISDKRVVSEIKSRYKDLPIIYYGLSTLKNEPNLHSLIKSFYRNLAGCY